MKSTALFIGHGSPMNAIEQNSYTEMLSKLGKDIPRPEAIVCISAHWETKGTWITHMQQPKTIHDFGAFPKELFAVQYPAPGHPKLAEEIKNQLPDYKIGLDDTQWGFDHGTWAILKHMYPKADIPVIQISIDATQKDEFHFELGKKLRFLRDKNILVLASGNIVHNLRLIDFQRNAKVLTWAQEFDQWVEDKLKAKDFKSLVFDYHKTQAGQLSVPTAEHYLPFLYFLGITTDEDQIHTEFKSLELGSISMRSLSSSPAATKLG